jgi:ubiquinone biosynthesis protein
MATIQLAAQNAPMTRSHNRASRSRQIVEVLSRHGLGFVLGLVNLPGRDALRPASLVRGHGGKRTAQLSGPEHLRMALEELGPTFIKLGQILSSRNDLLPQPYVEELAKLQDAAPPVPEDEIRAVLLAEVGRPIEEAFATFEMSPLASASIGQVHAATLLDGTAVVVKLRRPGVVEQVEEDLHILIDLALKASRRWEVARHYDLVAIAQEFAQTLRNELDYLHEGQNVERIAENFAGEPDIHIPRVFWETTTTRMLTLERLYGIKITDLSALDDAGLDRAEVAQRAARLLLTMIVSHGFFHADPHAGNFFVESGGRIGLIDFGMVGQVDAATRDLLLQMMISVSREDASRLADVLLVLGMAQVHVDRNALRRDLQRLLARYCGRALGDVKFGALLAELVEVIRWHHLRLAPDLALLIKTLGMGEGLAAQVYPDFNLMDVYIPLAEELLRAQFSPRRWLRQFLLTGIDALQMATELPQQLSRIMGDIERGGLEVTLEPASFDPYFMRLEGLVNRLVLALLATSLTIASALLLAAYHPVRLNWVAPVLFLCALGFAGVFGGYVAFLLVRTRQR